MNDDSEERQAIDSPEPGQATVRRRARISPVWLIPVVVALIGCWLVYQNFLSHGPQVTLLLDSAAGLEAGSTAVTVHSVEVGHVASVHLTDDHQDVVAELQMAPGTAKLLVADSLFWVVKPRVSRQGISGLGTILSGSYIELQPGTKSKAARRFTALKHPPVTPASANGIAVVLTSQTASNVHVGDPVLYQGQTAGKIEATNFSVADNNVHYQVFIKAPFDQLITRATRFWLRSGIDVHVGAGGLDVHAGSLRSIFTGGITFGSLGDYSGKSSVDSGAAFTLYANREAASKALYDQHIPYLVLLNDSVYGLSEGAPVLFRGLQVGTVERVPFFPPGFTLSKSEDYRIPVLIAIEPQRVDWVGWKKGQWRDQLQALFARGLHATIKPANLLTGAMLMTLKFSTKPKPYTPRTVGGYTVFPSTPGAISNIQQQIAELLDKFNQIQLGNLTSALESTLKSIDAATSSLNKLLESADESNFAATLQNTLDSLQKTLDSYQQGAPVYQQLQHSLKHLNRVLQDAGPLIETLKKHPNALIFGSPDQADPIPRAAP